MDTSIQSDDDRCTFLRNFYCDLQISNKSVGMTATAGVLTYGMSNMLSGNSEKSQKAMRMRVLAQFGTIVLVSVGSEILLDIAMCLVWIVSLTDDV
jgi:hypothetical protein